MFNKLYSLSQECLFIIITINLKFILKGLIFKKLPTHNIIVIIFNSLQR